MSLPNGRYAIAGEPGLAEGWELERLTPPSRLFGANGLRTGPDGRIYWSIGDKGLNVTSKEGVKYEYPNEGAMMRSEADGSNFEVYVRGLRNLQEPRFDAYGSWFGVDNDGDGLREKENRTLSLELINGYPTSDSNRNTAQILKKQLFFTPF